MKNGILKNKLKEVKAIKIRSSKHDIWELPNGQKITISTNRDDQVWEKVNIRLINKLILIKKKNEEKEK